MRDNVATSNCSGGTEEVLPIKVDHQVWAEYANVAAKMANLLTKLVIQGMVSMSILRRKVIITDPKIVTYADNFMFELYI